MTRKVSEWIGKTDDTKIPPRVILRVFLRFEGKCQCGCGLKIRSADRWDCDHRVALCNGGEHRESNLRPYLRDHHKIKTRADVALRAKTDRIRKRNIGIKKPRTIRQWRRFSGEPVFASRER